MWWVENSKKVEIESENGKWKWKVEMKIGIKSGKVGIVQFLPDKYREQLGYVDNSTKNGTNAHTSPICFHIYYYYPYFI